MAGLSGERLFRLEAHGRTLGAFRQVERTRGGVTLDGWEPEWDLRATPNRGTIVLTDPAGAELRRWDCGEIDWSGDGVVVRRIRRAVTA